MVKLPLKEWMVLAVMAFALAFLVQLLKATPVLSATGLMDQPASLIHVDAGTIATASEAPKLVPALLGGKPVYVLYSTRADDVILVRCYPTYQPSLTVKPMGGQPAQKEGTLTCKPGGAM